MKKVIDELGTLTTQLSETQNKILQWEDLKNHPLVEKEIENTIDAIQSLVEILPSIIRLELKHKKEDI